MVLGIPPKQYEALSGDKGGDIAAVLLNGLSASPVAFRSPRQLLPARQRSGDPTYASDQWAPYLPLPRKGKFLSRLRTAAVRLDIRHDSMTAFLRCSPPESVDCAALLDAQDWMSPAELNELWLQIRRTARPGARASFFRLRGQGTSAPRQCRPSHPEPLASR